MKKKETLKIFCSYPELVTGIPRRKNKEALTNPIVRAYLKILGDALKIKNNNFEEIRITYMGGYLNTTAEGKVTNENINTAKVFLGAINDAFAALGYGQLNLKLNLKIIDEKSFKNNQAECLSWLQKSDLLFLGIGSDKVFGHLLTCLEENGVMIKEIIEQKNIVTTSFCSGTVLSSQRIYGGKYDEFFENIPTSYPLCYETLNINPVTMETNMFSPNNEEKINQTFKEQFLLPDSYQQAFFGCRPNSFMISSTEQVLAFGEIYLFIDGKDYLVCDKSEPSFLTHLNELVNIYNETKEKTYKEQIMNLIQRKETYDVKKKITTTLNQFKNQEYAQKRVQKKLEQYITIEFINLNSENDFEIKKINKNFFKSLNISNLNETFQNLLNIKNPALDNFKSLKIIKDEESDLSINPDELVLTEEQLKETILKIKIIGIIKKYQKFYLEKKLDNLTYLNDIWKIIEQTAGLFPDLAYYFIECFACFYTPQKNQELLRKIGKEIKDLKKIKDLTRMRKLTMKGKVA